MPKAKVKICVRSSAGARPPKCYAVGTVVCPPCVVALETYRKVKAHKAAKRAKSNRASAERSRLNREQRSSDIHSDHLALKAEFKELVQSLNEKLEGAEKKKSRGLGKFAGKGRSD